MNMSDHPPPPSSPLTPVLFVSHGAPTFALEPGKLGAKLQTLGQALLKSSPSPPRAILVISAHWQTSKPSVPTILTHRNPPTIYDFGGFDEALYQLTYPAAGPSSQLVQRTAECLLQAGFKNVEFDNDRGFDHGVWVPLLHLFPQANIPVYQVSMPMDLTPSRAVELGRSLSPLREEGVLIMGSGGTTHNLFEAMRTPPDAPPSSKAMEFAKWVRTCILANDVQSLVEFSTLAPHAKWAHPTLEHYLPLLVAMGAATSGQLSCDDEKVQVMEGGFTYGVMAMDAYLWGGPEV